MSFTRTKRTLAGASTPNLPPVIRMIGGFDEQPPCLVVQHPLQNCSMFLAFPGFDKKVCGSKSGCLVSRATTKSPKRIGLLKHNTRSFTLTIVLSCLHRYNLIVVFSQCIIMQMIRQQDGITTISCSNVATTALNNHGCLVGRRVYVYWTICRHG